MAGITCVVVIIYIVVSRISYENKLTMVKLKNIENQEIIDKIFTIDSLRYSVLSKPFCPSSTMVKDTCGVLVELQKVLKEETLVVRFSDLDCYSCLKKEFQVLERYINEFQIPVIFLGSFFYHPEIAQQVQSIFNSFPILYLENDSCMLLRSLERLDTPYYIITDSTFSIKHAFLPDMNVLRTQAFFFNYLKMARINKI